MTRKDYVVIAAALHEARIGAAWLHGIVGVDTVHLVTDHLVAALAADNPRFDAAKFREASR